MPPFWQGLGWQGLVGAIDGVADGAGGGALSNVGFCVAKMVIPKHVMKKQIEIWGTKLF